MSHRFPVLLKSASVLAAAIATGWLATVPVSLPLAAQARTAAKPAAAKSKIPRTPDGHPDLQGLWSFATATPLERPKEFAEKEKLTAEEAAKLEQRAVENQFADTPPPPGDAGSYNRFWLDTGTKVIATRRTSLVVDPPDGKIPPLTPEAQKGEQARIAVRSMAAGPEDLNPWERCIVGFNAGPPIISSGYNNNLQIFQTRDSIAILPEMVHDARFVPLDGRPHLPTQVQQWSGDSRGHWDGDTLVIDVTNFRRDGSGNLPIAGYALPGRLGGHGGKTDENLHVVERFTRADADTLLYEFTVEDPTVWTRPWTASMSMSKSTDLMYEYACHEGNYAMSGILGGARVQEKAAAGKKSGSK
jgi:hypothetical protein